jgi:hypothetical protein
MFLIYIYLKNARYKYFRFDQHRYSIDNSKHVLFCKTGYICYRQIAESSKLRNIILKNIMGKKYIFPEVDIV